MPVRNRKRRKWVGNRRDLHVAAAGDIHGAAECLGNLAKHACHLRGCLKIKLIRRELHAPFIAHGLAGLNAQQDFLRVGIVVMQIVAVVRRYQRNSGLLRQSHQIRVHALLDFEALILNLEKEIIFSENVP